MAYNAGSDPTLAEQITAGFVPAVWSKQYLNTAMRKLVCYDSFNTSFKSDLRKGYIVTIPVFTAAANTEVTPGTEVVAGDLATTPVTITVDKWQYSAAEISDLIEIEMLADYLKGSVQELSQSIMKAIDLDVSSLFSTLGGSTFVNADGATFTDDTFIDLTEVLDEADVPDDGLRSLIGDPSTRADMMKIDKFVRMDYINGAPATNGKFGILYNATVKITNNLTATTTGNYGVLAHRDAIGLVIQSNPRLRTYNMGYKFITKIAMDAAWGADEIRDGFGKSFYTRKK